MGKAKTVKFGEREIKVKTISSWDMMKVIEKNSKGQGTPRDYLEASISDEDKTYLSNADWELNYIQQYNELLNTVIEVNPFLQKATEQSSSEKNFQEPSTGPAKLSDTPPNK